MMTARATYQARSTPGQAGASLRPTEEWERTIEAKRHVATVLHSLPPGFVVFDDLQLPKPSRAIVDHLVIGPRSVWAITSEVFADPVTNGHGRNDDTLWSGRTPLRTMLETADWESTAISDLIDHPVEPLLCLVAPSLPVPAFNFHGIRICEPVALAEQVGVSTAEFIDVSAVADIVGRVFGTEPARSVVLPTLGHAVLAPKFRAGSPPRRRRTIGARLHAIRRTTAVRTVAVLALLGGILAFLPTILGLWNSVAEEGADRITAVIDAPATTVAATPRPTRVVAPLIEAPPPVEYTITCPAPGSGWVLEWAWPGELPRGVAGYAIETRTNGATAIAHTLVPWSDPTAPPPSLRLADGSSTEVLTEYVAIDGAAMAATSESVPTPAQTC